MTDFNNVKLSSMEIKVLGTGCAKCKTLEAAVREVVEANNIQASITKIEDIKEIMNYKVMSTPALVINEVVEVKGRVPSKSEILEILKKY